MIEVQFLKSKAFILTFLLQVAGPFLMSFGDWANVIQYLSGFGMAYALFEWRRSHVKEIQELKDLVWGLHSKHDRLHDKIQQLGE